MSVDFLARYDRAEYFEKYSKIVSNRICWKRSVNYSEDDLLCHLVLRKLTLDQEVDKGRISQAQAEGASEFRIKFTHGGLQFSVQDEGSSLKRRVQISYEDINNRESIEAINYLIHRAKEGKFYSAPISEDFINETRKSTKNVTPLKRDPFTDKFLTRNFVEARKTILPKLLAETKDDPRVRRTIVKRFFDSHFLVYRLAHKIEVELLIKKDLIQMLNKPRGELVPESPQMIALQKEVALLHAMRRLFSRLDVYALTMGLVAFPVGNYSYEHLDRVVALVQESVRQDFEKKYPLFRFRREGIKQVHDLYIKEVGGLLHISRGQYQEYCQKQNIPQNKRGFVHLLLRLAVADENAQDFVQERIQGSGALSDFPENLKQEIAKMIREISSLGNIEENFPDDSRDYSGVEPKILSEMIEQRYAEINFNGTSDDVKSNRYHLKDLTNSVS